MVISFLKALDRKGKLKTLVELTAAAPGRTDLAKIVSLWSQFQTGEAEGVALRKQYSAVICCMENQVRPALVFPDVDEAKAQADANLRTAEAAAAVQAAQAAMAAVEAAAAAARKLADEARAMALEAGVEAPEFAVLLESAEHAALVMERDELKQKLAQSSAPVDGSATESVPQAPVGQATAEVPVAALGQSAPPPDD